MRVPLILGAATPNAKVRHWGLAQTTPSVDRKRPCWSSAGSTLVDAVGTKEGSESPRARVDCSLAYAARTLSWASIYPLTAC